ncbi:MAG TPA: peptidoglycan-binding protein [Xanthobacteraceae bacterium]|nr:peptidoglycan-binding protein [Xanthobacteraceae bacterium]
MRSHASHSRSTATAALDDLTLAEAVRRLLRKWIVAPMCRHPVDSFGLLLMFALALAVVVNALFLQSGKHPAPMRAIAAATADTTGSLVVMPRPRPAEAVEQANRDAPAGHGPSEVITEIQRQLARKGFYDGPVDGVYGPRVEGAIRRFEQAAGLKPGAAPDEDLLAVIVQARTSAEQPKPASPAAPSQPAPAEPPRARVVAVQRALAEFGYGQIKVTGVFDPATRSAIERFERERRLPVTGKLTDRLMRELAAVTGRPLE